MRIYGSDLLDEQQSTLLLDACVIINLYACGFLEDILDSIGGIVGIADRVQEETLYIRRGGAGDDAREREPIDLSQVLSRGGLSVVSEATEEELSTFIDLAMELGDGEAMTAALALHRGYLVVTDDRVALRVVAGRVPTLSTLDVIKRWAEKRHVSSTELRAAMRDLRQRGSYVPGLTHPLRPWWNQYSEAE